MATVEERKTAQRGGLGLLRLIAAGEISSVGDDDWVIYDDTVPQGHRVTWGVESLIESGLAKPQGYYDVLITDAGRALLDEHAPASGVARDGQAVTG